MLRMVTIVSHLVVLIGWLAMFDGVYCASLPANSSSYLNESCTSCLVDKAPASSLSSSLDALRSTSPADNSLGLGSYILQGLGKSSTNSQTEALSTAVSAHLASPSLSDAWNSTSSPFQYAANTTRSSLKANDTSSARSCAIALQNYIDASAAWFSNHTSSTTQKFAPSTGTSISYQYITTTLCDGVPRAISPSPVTVTTTAGGYWNPTFVAIPYPEKPPCSLDAEDCDLLLDVYSSRIVSYQSADESWLTYNSVHNVTGVQVFPNTLPVSPTCTPYTPCDSCQVSADSVRLLYWPSTAVPNNGICPSPNGTDTTTFTATQTGYGPNTQVFDGMTLTSPTAYMSFGGVVVSWCSNQSTIKTNTIIPVNPTDVSSLRSVITPARDPGAPDNVPYVNYAGPYSFNYGDFNTPMPYSAYTNAWFCFQEPSEFCNIMTPDNYGPILQYPSSFIQIVDPSLSTCGLAYAYRGVYDPPHALQQQPSAALPMNPHKFSASSPAQTSSRIPADPATSPANSASAKSSPVPPTPSPTPYIPPGASSPKAPPLMPPSTGQHTAGSGTSKDPSGGDPIPEQGSGSHAPQPSQQPSAAASPSDPDPDPDPDPHVTGSGGSESVDPGHAPDPANPSKNAPNNAGDPAQDAGGNIVGILSAGGGQPQSPGSGTAGDPAQNAGGHIVGILNHGGGGQPQSPGSSAADDPGNAGLVNEPEPDPSGNGGAAIISMLAHGGTSSEDTDPQADPSSNNAGVEGPGVVAAMVGSEPIYQVPNDPSSVRVAGATLHEGDQTEIGGTPVSMGSGYIVVGSGAEASKIPLTGNEMSLEEPILTLGSKIYTAYQESGQNGAVVIDSQTLSIGGSPVTVGGHVVSLGGDGIVIDGRSTAALDVPVTADPAMVAKATAVLSFGSQQITAFEESNGDMVIGTQTLSVGGPAITMDGHLVSLGSQGVVIDGRSTVAIGPSVAAGQDLQAKATAVISLGSSKITAFKEGNGDMIIGTRTLSVGGSAITVDGHTLSDARGGIVVDNSRTVSWSEIPGALGTEEARITAADGKVLTVVEEPGHASTIVVDGSITLSVGGQDATVDGEVISFASGALVVNGSVTETLSSMPTTTFANSQPVDKATSTASNARNTGTTSATSTSTVLKVPDWAFGILCFFYLFAS
ncbi:MAG: hypothetical protein M1821_005020 [Bathelium mastoideum]|nr:MAG: hypothetical protein M1821_005020 [Bathelium mastoideum]